MGTSSLGLACFVDPETTETRVVFGTWMNSPNCNAGADGNPITGPDEEVDGIKEPKCFQDMTYFGPNPEDAMGGPTNYEEMSPEDREKYPWSIQKIACGPNPAPWTGFNGIIEVSYSNQMDCMGNMIQNSDTVWGHMMESCIDVISTATDANGNIAVDADGKRIWNSYKILGCSPATDVSQEYGLKGSNAILGVYMNKGCKADKFLYEYTDVPSSMFLEIQGVPLGTCGSPNGLGPTGGEQSAPTYSRAFCMNMA